MFNNVGRKIKTMSKVLCILVIVLIIVFTLIIMANGGLISEEGTITTMSNRHYYRDLDFKIPSGLIFVYGIVLCIGVYFSSLLTYGFGQLIENTSLKGKEAISSNLESTNDKQSTAGSTESISTTKRVRGMMAEFFNPNIQQKTTNNEVHNESSAIEKKDVMSSSEVLAQKQSFLDEIETMNSMVEIWNCWRKYNLSTTYPTVNNFIRECKDIEQLHGKSEGFQFQKESISKMF